MQKLNKPNYKKCNMNISSTLAEYLGVQNTHQTLPTLAKKLKNNYKNIVFICFDGMGINPLKINLNKTDFLRKNIERKLLSTFPSTTTNATTSLIQNKLPLQHGYLGWSVYYENIGKNIDIFLNADSWTEEKLLIDNAPIDKMEYYFEKNKSDYNINLIYPSSVKVDKNYNLPYETLEEFFKNIKYICNKKDKQYIYAYCTEPDSTMHMFGVSSGEAREIFVEINKRIQDLYNELDNTIIIITADHGQVDIDGYVEVYNDQTLMEMLKIYPYLETRATAFIVKDGLHKEFEKYFAKNYGKDFKLFKSNKLIEKGYFGNIGNKGKLLGDYIAVAKNNKMALLTPNYPRFKGHHSSLTKEMKVPLIVLEKTKV